MYRYLYNTSIKVQCKSYVTCSICYFDHILCQISNCYINILFCNEKKKKIEIRKEKKRKEKIYDKKDKGKNRIARNTIWIP